MSYDVVRWFGLTLVTLFQLDNRDEPRYWSLLYRSALTEIEWDSRRPLTTQ